MNDENKNYVRIGAYVVCAALVASLAWLLFRDVRADGGSDVDVTKQLDSASAEQRATEESLNRIDRGLDSSDRTVDSAAEAVSSAQESADRIAESADIIETAVNRVESRNNECKDILADSQRRITESQRIIQEIQDGAGTSPGAASATENSVADIGGRGNIVRR